MPNETLSIKLLDAQCPDFRGTLRPAILRHGKKDTSMPCGTPGVAWHGAKKDISMHMGLTRGNYVALSKGQE